MKNLKWIAMILCCAGFLSMGTLPGKLTKNLVQASSAEILIKEVEPNDAPLSAQRVPFPAPGETLVYEGRVAGSDRGSVIDEAEDPFYGDMLGRFQDWLIIDPDSVPGLGDGPLPLRFSLSWEGEADLNAVVGMLVDQHTFILDGFRLLSDIQMITSTHNVESWPKMGATVDAIVLYLQPEVTGIGNAGFGRKLIIGIQSVGEGQQTIYRMKMEHGAGDQSFERERHQVDGGGIAARAFDGFQGNWVVNRFRPSRYPATLTTMSYPFVRLAGPYPDPTGLPIRMIVFAGSEDGADTQPPSHPPLLIDQVVRIPDTISHWLEGTIDLPINPSVTIDSGVLYVGFQFPDAPLAQTGLAPAFDVTAVQYLRTYDSKDGGATWHHPTAKDYSSKQTVFMNADIRAMFLYSLK